MLLTDLLILCDKFVYLAAMSATTTERATQAENIRGTGSGEGGAVTKEDPPVSKDSENPPVDARPPGVDVHAVLGLPRPKRPSERSDQAEGQGEGSDTDDVIDTSDDDTEEWQEGEYIVIDPEDEERKELQTQMLAETASRARDSLVPIFTTCCAEYDKWIQENLTAVSEKEMSQRRKQLQLYQKVLELYGSDVEWQGLTHAQQVSRNKMAHDTSLEAKLLGPPPSAVTEASVADQCT